MVRALLLAARCYACRTGAAILVVLRTVTGGSADLIAAVLPAVSALSLVVVIPTIPALDVAGSFAFRFAVMLVIPSAAILAVLDADA